MRSPKNDKLTHPIQLANHGTAPITINIADRRGQFVLNRIFAIRTGLTRCVLIN